MGKSHAAVTPVTTASVLQKLQVTISEFWYSATYGSIHLKIGDGDGSKCATGVLCKRNSALPVHNSGDQGKNHISSLEVGAF